MDIFREFKSTFSDNFGIAGDPTSTYIAVQSTVGTSATAYIDYINNNGVKATYTASQIGSSAGWFIVIWEWNVSVAGFPLASILDEDDGLSAADLSDYLGDIQNGVYGTCMFAIGSKGWINSDQQLYDQMVELRSGMFQKLVGTSGNTVSNSYAAIGYYNEQFAIAQLLTEDFQRGGSFTMAYTQFHPETIDSNNIGYIGYLRDMLIGRGIREMEGNGTLFQNAFNPKTNTSQLSFLRVSPGEYVRLSATAILTNDSQIYGSYIQFKIEEKSSGTSVGSSTLTFRNNNWTDVELYYQLQNANSDEIEVTAIVGGVTNNCETQHYGITSSGRVRNMELYKCGFTDPEPTEELRVTEHTVTAGDLITSPGFWNPMNASSFADTATTGKWYLTDQNLHTNGNQLRNWYSDIIGYSWPKTFGTGATGDYLDSACNSADFRIGTPYGNTHFAGSMWPYDGGNFKREHRNYGQDSVIEDYQIGDSINSINEGPGGKGSGSHAQYGNKVRIDPSKHYILGWWVQVNDWESNNNVTAYNRISMIARGFEKGTAAGEDGFDSTPVKLLDQTGTPIPDNELATMSVSADFYQANPKYFGDWKLYYAMFLPYESTQTYRDKWVDAFWGTWSGLQEIGEGSTDGMMTGFPGTANELATCRAGYIAEMTETTTYIAANLRIEWHKDTNGMITGFQPFAMEIDPLNFKKDANGNHIVAWNYRTV
jgi:hypothetical protein